MKVGVPKEIKNKEFRVAMVPAGVRTLVAAGHKVFIEKGAGTGSGISDEEYSSAGASIVEKASDVWSWADLPEEYKYLRKDLILFLKSISIFEKILFCSHTFILLPYQSLRSI